MNAKISVDGHDIALAPIVRISYDAGKAIMDIYNQPTEDWAVQTKSDDSPLTKADLAANAVICEALSKMHGFPIMSEEMKAAEYATRSNWNLYWCIDPMDGTKEFVRRNGEFTVNIALLKPIDAEDPSKGARPILGVVYAPAIDKLYFGAEGIGAWYKDGDKEPVQISVNTFSEADEGLTIVCSRSHLSEDTKKFMEKFTNVNTKSMGSSLKFMLVASSDAHVYPRLAPTMEWDTAASQIIVEEAGGEVLNYETNEPMVYNKENLLNPFFLVYGKRQPADN